MSALDEVLMAVYRKDLAAICSFSAGDVNGRDEDGRTPLMHAVLAEDASPEVVALLVERGADICAHDALERWTALHFAARGQRRDLVETLLHRDAQVDPVDRYGNTPLWRCVSSASADLSTLTTLVSYGADAERKNDDGMSPSDVASEKQRYDILRALDPRA
jgi:ankyrin repeat protein